jgi:hypothetical protein
MRGLRALYLLGLFLTGTAVAGRTVATTRAGSPVAVAVAFISLASASAEESPRVPAKLSECAPGVPLLSGAKLACMVTRCDCGVDSCCAGEVKRDKRFHVARSKREVMLNLELGHPRFCR